MLIGYHASHEQFSPSELLNFVQAAERAGFGAIMTSDHIAPWSEQQGNSGNNWAWLGAALATTSLPFGSLAIPGGWRYHPALLAHLAGTLAQMYPNRFGWIAVGSGEALNESVVGSGWPEKAERDARLRAGADIVRDLLRGETVTVRHPWFAVEEAKLWSLPAQPPEIFGAALTAKTAGWMADWVDGLITVRKSKESMQELVGRFEDNGGRGKPLVLQLQVSWAASKEEARLAAWQQWRSAAAPPTVLADLKRPKDFDEFTKNLSPADMDELILMITDGSELLEILGEVALCGFEEIYVHNVSRDQYGFLRFMAQEVLPHIR
ncbi:MULTISPECIES: TIGR03885 family FMN-dependent LLM class oxidoreductase [unclassified Rhizobium]|uniref:TIGR03885 family FMN-dependent LLM class oxidoreductase n=1 Tax=unclassified Rhizobium TaxID=2613769 RepID=UPI000BE8DF39|nr:MULTISPECIES: TIGR03885 family FMN-dependent LLM class oxidoreductase [unclassified Rhizobium]MDF0664056.1 TIGR03885 family FMN-dependent LLM class oxidoreductase [Rhizobium sp. BC49]PDS79017.1 LLM class F420-dependent oxidoreductase [Rhizobium sp. L18]